ncbi:probable E3 ubiquitin-protein ligase DTX2 isoform X2 [Rana temporaria]|uniref:probable E3 ubiquitin-protein ligase DTX2 isoform X2 n=1 Tax=Rana temporaria TaxID=8407 RepID=UPI001AACAD82|nr:probable E3 ubiquitin-protein ligase DTX2 isoform X2 [Rana temporaria]
MAAGPPQSGGATGPLGPPTMASQWNPASMAVAVWEWQDELGKWRPYSSQVSNYIEQCMQSHQQQKTTRALANSRSISLGQVDPKLAPYIIDIATLAQFRQDTGTMRYIRKILCLLDSAPAKGIFWEWINDDGCWTAYETHISIILEEKFSNKNPSVDLGAVGLPYLIDFQSLVQINQVTGYKRRVQRTVGTPYPTTPKAGPAHKATACACHQCLANSHGGPMHRYRHSMINLPTASNYQSGGRTTMNSVGYLPYPKPTMTSAKSAPKLNSTWVPPAAPLQLPGPSANGIGIPSVPVQIQKSSSMNQAFAGVTDPEQVVKKYVETIEKPSEEDCIICMETLSTPSGYSETSESKSIKPTAVGKLKKCGHIFHQLCMFEMYSNGNKDGSLQCPSCKTIYGEKTGTQPKGKMEIYLIPQSLPGHQDCGTIHIIYTINPGIQGPEHPNPGRPYSARGFPRHCYLPDNDRGRLVLELLKVAWARRLIFTIGVSSTTGESDTVVWNEIHHKTEMTSNITGHGFPDANYLDNVLAELASQGVSENCLNM